MPQIVKKYRKELLLFAAAFPAAVLCYSVLITNELTNTIDGMWIGSRYEYYAWVVTIGRWFWPVIGLMRRSLSPEPFTSLVSIGIITAGACLIVRMFTVKSRGRAALVVSGLLINTAVCVFLSFRFMSPTFAFAFFLACFPVYLLRSKSLKLLRSKSLSEGLRCAAAAVCLVLMLALYQADLGCYCLLILLLAVKDLSESADWKQAVKFIVKAGLAAALACVAYKIIWDTGLRFFHVKAAGYKGADRLSLGRMILCFPSRFLDAYRTFFFFFYDNSLKHHIWQDSHVCAVILIMLTAGVLFVAGAGALRFSRIHFLLSAAVVLMIPAAANVSMLIAVDGGDPVIQMTMPFVMVCPCLLALMDGIRRTDDRKAAGVTAICTVLMVFVLYGSFIMVSVDQHIMLTSRRITLSLMDRVIQKVESETGLDPESEIVFIGKPVDNPLYRKDEVWDFSNPCARYGDFWLSGDGCTMSYGGLLRDGGYNIRLVEDHDYWHELEKEPDIREMPVYPQDGFIKRSGKYVIVKLSDQ